jgi:tetratricopeptide (TPR) repeat protein
VRAIALGRGGGNRTDLVRALGALAHVVRDRGESERALGLSQEAVALCRQPVDPLLLAHTVRHLGDVQRELGRLAEAKASYDEALALYRAAPDAPGLDFANALRAAAVLADAAGEADTARPLWAEAGRLYRRAGVREGVEESERRRTGAPTGAG